jgi:hypothetical protein
MWDWQTRIEALIKSPWSAVSTILSFVVLVFGLGDAFEHFEGWFSSTFVASVALGVLSLCVLLVVFGHLVRIYNDRFGMPAGQWFVYPTVLAALVPPLPV